MCSFQTRTYAQLLRMRACCKFFKQEGQKVWKSIKPVSYTHLKEDWVVVVGHHPIYAETGKKENERIDTVSYTHLIEVLCNAGNV